ncbi:DUF6898 family protein [Thalassospira sp.]
MRFIPTGVTAAWISRQSSKCLMGTRSFCSRSSEYRFSKNRSGLSGPVLLSVALLENGRTIPRSKFVNSNVAMTTRHNTSNEIYFELRQVGTYLRCTAIDGKTGVEVTVAGPVSRNPEQLKRVAAQKLEYVLKKG